MSVAEPLKFCACCPAPCRSALAPGSEVQDETGMPSSLSMIALAVMAGELALDTSVQRALRRTSMARPCIAACPYGLDVIPDIEKLLAERGTERTSPQRP
jgi:hypothetical protein